MKKGLFGFLSLLLVFGLFLPQVSASENNVEKEKVVTQKVKDLTKGTGIEVIDPSELPEGTEFVNFDTVEDFEKAVKEYKKFQNQVDKFDPSARDGQANSEQNGGKPTDIGINATATGSIKWNAYQWWNPMSPLNMTINFNYSYYYSSGYKWFTGVSNINSYSSPGFPTNWVQTNKTGSVIDGKRTLQITIKGYHLFGASIGGVPFGYKSPATYTKYYYR